MIPPPSAVIMARVTTPTMSSRASRSALTAKANVPARSSASSSGGSELIRRFYQGPSRAIPPDLHVESAVHPPDLAGDVAGGVGGEEVHDPGDLLGPAEPPHGDLGRDRLEHLLGHGLDHLGGDVARRHGVHREPDAVAELAGALQL